MLSKNQMVKAVEATRKMAKRAQEATYEGLCTIIEHRYEKNAETKLSEEREVIVMKDQPCRLSFEKLDSVIQTETAAMAAQGIKLFLAPEVEVNCGSKIIVTQNGVTGEYSASGKSAVYSTHQEVILELFRGWA